MYLCICSVWDFVCFVYSFFLRNVLVCVLNGCQLNMGLNKVTCLLSANSSSWMVLCVLFYGSVFIYSIKILLHSYILKLSRSRGIIQNVATFFIIRDFLLWNN